MSDGPAFLLLLDARIEARVRAIGEEHAWWPCGRGCDACCRSLGEMPHATCAEWERLDAGLRQLPARVQAEIEERLASLVATAAAQPVLCPFLDRGEGTCLVYAHRLLACRSYGYFVSRGDGRWCHVIEAELAARDVPVLFGNLDAVMEDARAAGGESITLAEWWRDRGRAR